MDRENHMQEGRKKVGILGGTFDPVHIGHLILALDSLEQLGLSSVWFMPSGKPPHKRHREGRATDEQRIEMVRRAISGSPFFEMHLDDMEPESYSYTYRLMERLSGEYPDTDFYFLIGADSLADFDTWVEPGRILSCCRLGVALRGEWSYEKLRPVAERLQKQFSGKIELLHSHLVDISSEELRKRRAQGKEIRYFVPQGVDSYIREQGLYKVETEQGGR